MSSESFLREILQPMEERGNLRMVSRGKTFGIVRKREQDNTEFMYFSFHCADAFF